MALKGLAGTESVASAYRGLSLYMPAWARVTIGCTGTGEGVESDGWTDCEEEAASYGEAYAIGVTVPRDGGVTTEADDP